MSLARVLGVGVCVSVLGLVGCGGGSEGGGDASARADESVRVVEYTVRGVVRTMPGEMTDMMARHEAIPEFDTGEMNADGTKKLGMNVMTMAFPAAEGYAWDELAVGDVVALTFAVRHDAETNALMGYELVRHEALPADTALDFTPLPGRGAEDDGDADGGGGAG